MVRKTCYLLLIFTFVVSCKNWYYLPDNSVRPKKTMSIYSKLYNKNNIKLEKPIIYLNHKTLYYDTGKEDYLHINKDINYDTYLILLDSGRCFTNSLLKNQDFNNDIFYGKNVSIGYYIIDKENSIELEIFGTSNGGFFGYENGKIHNDTLVLYSGKNHKDLPQYIKFYTKTNLRIDQSKLNIDW